MNGKKRLRVAVIPAALLLVLAMIVVLTRERNSFNIEIGAVIPLTGPSAQYGKWQKQGVDLACHEIEQEGRENQGFIRGFAE